MEIYESTSGPTKHDAICIFYVSFPGTSEKPKQNLILDDFLTITILRIRIFFRVALSLSLEILEE